VSAAHCAEKEMPFSPTPSALRSLSLAVIEATGTPASASAARMVPVRTKVSSSMTVSIPVARSRKKFPDTP